MQLVAAWQLIENATRVGQLIGDPLLRFGSAAIFQPAIRVDNLVAEVVVGDGLLFGGGRLGNIHRRWSALFCANAVELSRMAELNAASERCSESV